MVGWRGVVEWEGGGGNCDILCMRTGTVRSTRAFKIGDADGLVGETLRYAILVSLKRP